MIKNVLCTTSNVEFCEVSDIDPQCIVAMFKIGRMQRRKLMQIPRELLPLYLH